MANKRVSGARMKNLHNPFSCQSTCVRLKQRAATANGVVGAIIMSLAHLGKNLCQLFARLNEL